MSQYYPLICWKVDVGGMGFKIEFETSPATWTTETSTVSTTNNIAHAAGAFTFEAGQSRYGGKFDASSDIFTALEQALTVILITDGLASGVTISEIETDDDAFLRGGMPARRIRIDIAGATGFTRFRIKPIGGATPNLIPTLGGLDGDTYTSDTNFSLVMPYAYNGAFFLPAWHTHDLRIVPMAVGSVRAIQEVQSSVVIRRKTAMLSLTWRAVPAALVKNDGRYFEDSRARSGVDVNEEYACFENFWHECVLGSKQARVFRDASPAELDCSTCEDVLDVDFGGEDSLDMGNLLTELHQDMGFEAYDISIMGKISYGSRLRLT